MSSTPINFPKDRTELDPALNPDTLVNLLVHYRMVTHLLVHSSYVWRQDSSESYGRWRNEDPGASGDGRYVLKVQPQIRSLMVIII